MKEFTSKQVFFLVAAIVVGIAFMETPAAAPVWSLIFWRSFLYNILKNSIISAFMVIALGVVTRIFNDEDS